MKQRAPAPSSKAWNVNPPVPTLLEVQHAVYRSIVGRDDAEAAAYIVAEGIDPEARLGIYRNTFASVLTNALRLTFPGRDKQPYLDVGHTIRRRLPGCPPTMRPPTHAEVPLDPFPELRSHRLSARHLAAGSPAAIRSLSLLGRISR